MRFVRFWLPVFLWMAVIFAFSAKQDVKVASTQEENFLIFKTLHMVEYAFLYVFSFRAFRNASGVKRRSVAVAAFLVTILYAVTDEIHQLFIPSREGRLRDVIIDSVGASIAWMVLTTWLPTAPRRLRSLAGRWQLI